jgi:hypothetical protein
MEHDRSLDELIARWEQEEVTVEDVIGEILQRLRRHNERLRELERARRATQGEGVRG